MKTQKSSYNKTVKDFIKRYNPYEGAKPLGVDLVAYLEYVEKNQIPTDKITPELLKQFAI